jgi:hypothetical protein
MLRTPSTSNTVYKMGLAILINSLSITFKTKNVNKKTVRNVEQPLQGMPTKLFFFS